MGIISWIVFGLIVGAVARFVMPGRQNMGLFMTILLGVVGSFAGGVVSAVIFGSIEAGVRPSGWIMSIFGAILVLFLYSRLSKDKDSRL
jgi:uncharacterized membrane protein YeaQ/YmgE (transglycosylase-associated protein family)